MGLAFSDGPGVIYEDELGENEIRVLLAKLAGSDEVQTVVPLGWGGDRYRVSPSPEGTPRSSWCTAWDDSAAADRFMRNAAPGLRSQVGRATVRRLNG